MSTTNKPHNLDKSRERTSNVDGQRLLDSYNAFIDKIKRRRTPDLHLNMQLSADLGLDSITRVELPLKSLDVIES